MTAATTNPASAAAVGPVRLPAHLLDATVDESALRRFLAGLPGVDPVGVEQRSARNDQESDSIRSMSTRPSVKRG